MVDLICAVQEVSDITKEGVDTSGASISPRIQVDPECLLSRDGTHQAEQGRKIVKK